MEEKKQMKNLRVYESVVGSHSRINEAAIATAAISQKMANVAKIFTAFPNEAFRISSGGATAKEQSMMEDIVECIQKKGLQQLMVLTTEIGAVALGAIVSLMAFEAAPIFLAGMLCIILNQMLPSKIDAIDEIESLMDCLGKKGYF